MLGHPWGQSGPGGPTYPVVRELGEAGVKCALVGRDEDADELLLLRCQPPWLLPCQPPLPPQCPPLPQRFLRHDHCRPATTVTPGPGTGLLVVQAPHGPPGAQRHHCPVVPSPQGGPTCPLSPTPPLLSPLCHRPLLSPCPWAAPSPLPPCPSLRPHPGCSSLSHVSPCPLQVPHIPFPPSRPTQVLPLPSASRPPVPLRPPLYHPIPSPRVSSPLSLCHCAHCPSACPHRGTSGGGKPGTADAWPW